MSTAAQRTMAARAAAYTKWSQEDDRVAAMRPARRGWYARFERQVDPDGTLPPAERARRADAAMKAHMARLALASSKARAAKKARRAVV